MFPDNKQHVSTLIVYPRNIHASLPKGAIIIFWEQIGINKVNVPILRVVWQYGKV